MDAVHPQADGRGGRAHHEISRVGDLAPRRGRGDRLLATGHRLAYRARRERGGLPADRGCRPTNGWWIWPGEGTWPPGCCRSTDPRPTSPRAPREPGEGGARPCSCATTTARRRDSRV